MSSYIAVSLRQTISARYLECCAYCQSAEFLMGVTFEIEHIIPEARGGQTILENLCLSCPHCNRHKATRTSGYDLLTGLTVPLFHPHNEEWADHFLWNENGTILLGLTPTGRATIEALEINRPMIVQLRSYWVALRLHPPKLNQLN